MSGEFVINDDNWQDACKPTAGFGTGLEPPDFAAGDDPSGVIEFPYPEMTDAELMEAAREQEAEESSLYHKLRRAGVVVKTQKQTSLCWGFSTVSAFMAARIGQGLPHIELSPASVTCLVNNFQNAGGWPLRAMQKLVTDGAVPSSLWPDTAMQRNLDNDTTRKAREPFKVLEWAECKTRRQHLTALAMRLPTIVCLDYWAHAVYDVQLLVRNGKLAVRFLNSHDVNYGDQGAGIREGSKVWSSGTYVPIVVKQAGLIA